MTASEQWLDGTGGKIFVRQWAAHGAPKANLVICHGFNAHSGQYEAAADVFTAHGYAVTAADLRGRGRSDGERFYVEKVDDYVALVRRDRYPRGLFVKGADTGKKLLRIVRGGGAIALLADLRDRNGLSVPFFDRPAPSTTFPALLARGSDALLVAARVIRTRGVRFRIEAEILDIPRTADRNADIDAATHLTHRLFEKWVREYPEQWMWAHRRWG